MNEILNIFYVDWRLMLAQMFNFAVVFVVLYIFAWKPILKILNDRNKQIEESLSNAEKIKASLEMAEADYKETVLKAQKDAQQVLEDGKRIAEKNRADLISKTKEEVEKIINEAKKQIEKEREQMMLEAKGKIIDLVILITEKILNKKVDAMANEELVNEILNQVKKGEHEKN